MAAGDTANILNGYRSITYNFTLAAVTPANLKDPESYRNKKLPFVIARSAGKGVNALQSSAVIPTQSSSGDQAEDDTAKKKTEVDSFNKESPGAFDLFIDNVELDTIMAPNEQTGAALGTKVKFEIYEPFSINGFIEALHVAARAAGWSGYINASFLLKIEFWGYSDKDTGPSATPQKIPADKYVIIKLTGAEIEVTEQGTRYRCTGIPVNESAYSNANKLTAQRQMTGNTVHKVISDLFDGLNEGEADKAENSTGKKRDRDRYTVFFPKEPDDGEALKLDTNVISKIGLAKINEVLKENTIYRFPPLKDKETKPNAKYNPSENSIQFAAGSDILDIITAVIRDSHYMKSVLENLDKEAKSGDGMIDYFQVTVNTIPVKLDSSTNKQLYEFQYIITPYKVHFSKLPDQQFNKFDPSRLKAFVKRTYDYLYGGKNVDIINFKLNFNNLFFQAANPNMGNKPTSEKATSAAPSGGVEVTRSTNAAAGASNQETEASPSVVIPEASSQSGRASPGRTDPYYQISYNAHQAILESVNMITGNLELLGDPFFLCTSGMSNYLAKIKDVATTADGEANFTQGPVIVKLNFRNPIDIDSDSNSPTYGLLKFKDLAPFSGLYQVLKCQSTFRDGVFKQTIKLLRYQGQIDAGSNEKEKFAEAFNEAPDSDNTIVTDSARPDIQKYGAKANDLNLLNLINKGLPTNGLPGQLLNIADTTIAGVSGALSRVNGVVTQGVNLLNQVAGPGGAISIGSALPAINALSAGLRANAAALANISNVTAGISAVANKFTVGGSTENLDNPFSGQLNALASKLTSEASNIGVKPGVLSSDRTAAITKDAIERGLDVDKALANASVYTGAPVNPTALTALANNLDVTKFIGASDSGFVGPAADKIDKLFSTDPTGLTANQKSAVIADAMAKGVPVDQALRNASVFGVNLPGVSEINAASAMSKLGFSAAQLSGVANLDSKVFNQIEEISKSIPKNVNLAAVKEQGIILGGLTADTLQNLPATEPKAVAPWADLPDLGLTPAEEKSLMAALAAGALSSTVKSKLPKAVVGSPASLDPGIAKLNNLVASGYKRPKPPAWNATPGGAGTGGGGGSEGGGGGNVVVGPFVAGPGGSGKVARDPSWDYAAHSFFENQRHDKQYFAIEYAGMDYLPKTGVAALPTENARQLMRDYAVNVLGWASDEGIPSGGGEVSFLDPNYKPPRSLQEYMLTNATANGWLDGDGRSTLPPDLQQQYDAAQLASLNPYIQAQLERIKSGEQQLVNPSIPSAAEIAAAAAASVDYISGYSIASDPNLIGGPVQQFAQTGPSSASSGATGPAEPEPIYDTSWGGGA